MLPIRTAEWSRETDRVFVPEGSGTDVLVR